MPSPEKEPIPGYDLAGTVVVAPPSSPFQPGSEVYARSNYFRSGCAREFTIATTEELAFKPRNLDWVHAATVPLSALTAWQALFIQAGLSKSGEKGLQRKRVLVTAASGGVGGWLVQLASWAGYEVVGTCGPENVELVRKLGATEVLDYRTIGLKEWVEADETRKVDAVIDCLGGKTLGECWACMKDGGALVSINQPPEQVQPKDWAGTNVKNLFFIMEPNGKQLEEVTKLVEQGTCEPVLDSVWKFEQYDAAFKKLDGGHARGKIVLRIRE
jgi:NADPH:quinone reductase-like Zn-dependent oxidoreductase